MYHRPETVAAHTYSDWLLLPNQLVNIYWAFNELGTAEEIETDKDMALLALVIYL